MMARFWRTVSLIFGCTFALTFLVQIPSLFSSVSISNVFVRASNGQDTSILSFTAGNPNPNSVFAPASYGQYGGFAQSLSITADGRWIISRSPLRGNTFNGLPAQVYARTGMPLTNPPIYTLMSSTSADGHTLFYISIDAAGRDETYNFLNLATGEQAELVVGPLNSPPASGQPGNSTNCTRGCFGCCQGNNVGFGGRLRQSFPEFAIPVRGWTLNSKQVVFMSLDQSARLLQSAGFFSLDLSGIDMGSARTYPLPVRKTLPTVAQHTSAGMLSSDGKLLAYLFNSSTDNLSGANPAPADGLAILDLSGGNATTIHAQPGDVITSMIWDSEGETLFYVETSAVSDRTGSQSLQIHQVDGASGESKQLPMVISAASAYSSYGNLSPYFGGVYGMDFAVCGKTFFYASGGNLHSISLDDPGNDQTLFSAGRINILSCAPGYAWNAANAIALRSPA